MGEGRQVAVCRELTKRFEEVRRGTAGQVAEHYAATPPKGEVVILVDRSHATANAEDMQAALRDALAQQSLKDAVRSVSDALGLARRDVYQAALAMEKDG